MDNPFSADSKLMTAFSKLSHIMLLNLLYVITCIPIFTIGAATTAMYSVLFKLNYIPKLSITKTFFKAFKENWKQSTIIWLIIFAFGLPFNFNVVFFYVMESGIRYLYLLFMLLSILFWIVFSYIFPLLSQFENSNKQTIKNAFLIGILHLPRSIIMALLNALPIIVLWKNPMLFAQLGVIWNLLYFGLSAAICSKLLKKPFSPYWGDQSPFERDELDGPLEN